MYRCLLRVLTITVAGLTAACATSPSDHSVADGHEAAMKTHQALAQDFEKMGNQDMARYHMDRAAIEDERRADAECGLLCTIIEDLLFSDGDSASSKSCRDPIMNPPSAPPRC